MDHYMYVSLIPEALIMSMLPPSHFGNYLATGTKKRAKEQALFFEVNGDLKGCGFDIDAAVRKCIPHNNGEPKHSVYVATYRVLENVPLDVLGSLWLVTQDGRSLELKPDETAETDDQAYHLYHELCPVHPLIASKLAPGDFCRFITDPANSISVPKICFADLRLGDLLEDPAHPHAGDLPYSNIEHLADCLLEMISTNKVTKTVNRVNGAHVPYRCIKSGFYVGDNKRMIRYPYPSPEELDRDHHLWWRSAQMT